MTYSEFIIEKLHDKAVGEPIFITDLAAALAKEFGLEPHKAAAATSVAMKRILDRGLCPNLRLYKKGIYFLTTTTPFGEVEIDDEQLIQRKYLANDEGYETDYNLLYLLGLTTQFPAYRVIATNKAKDCLREDKELGVFVRPAKTKVTQDNKRYLQMLDALTLLDKAPVDAENYYAILHNFVAEFSLRYDKLLALADEYYPKKTIMEIAHVANAGGVL